MSNRVSTVLYVDDEAMACKYFARACGADFAVLTAADADAAIKVLQTRSDVAILVTDYRMPGRNGASLLRQVEQAFPHVLRLLVTAYADRDVLLETVNSGEVFRVLEKPLDIALVKDSLRQASELARQRCEKRQRLLAMDETLAFLAHELNTPLRAIGNFALGTLQRTNGETVSPRQQAEIVRAAQEIDDNARYCMSLLDTFVESVQHADGLNAAYAPSTARQLIASLLDTYPLTSVQRAAIRLEEGADFTVAALPNCVALVLSSILGNALRALKNQAVPEICFTTSAGDSPKIVLRDNGPGIPPDIMQRLLSDSVTMHADEGGKGWGMLFCKRIMQSFGGSIEMHSEFGEGVTVTLNFPSTHEQRCMQ